MDTMDTKKPIFIYLYFEKTHLSNICEYFQDKFP